MDQEQITNSTWQVGSRQNKALLDGRALFVWGGVVSVLMPVLAMYMLVGNFLGGCLTYVHNLEGEAQGFAAKRVVAVQQYGWAFDLGDEIIARGAIRAGALDLAAYLDAGGEVRPWAWW